MGINTKKEYIKEVAIREIEARSILRKNKKIESWFLTSYGMNLYRGCMHNCVYCDGRNEKYRVDGNFGQDISIKINDFGRIILFGHLGCSFGLAARTYQTNLVGSAGMAII